MGLDPGLGVLHADLRARDSLAVDVMEAVRPEVDAWFLGLVERRVLRRNDFVERRDGSVRILAPLSHELAETVSLWRNLLGPIVEGVARALAADPESRVGHLPTLLTGDRRSAGRQKQRRPPLPRQRVVQHRGKRLWPHQRDLVALAKTDPPRIRRSVLQDQDRTHVW